MLPLYDSGLLQGSACGGLILSSKCRLALGNNSSKSELSHFLKAVTTLVDLLFIELMLHLSHLQSTNTSHAWIDIVYTIYKRISKI